MQNYDNLIDRGYPKPFMVTTSAGDGSYSRNSHAGLAWLHVSGALLIQGEDGVNVVYGPGLWENITYETQPPRTASAPRTF